MTRGKTEKTTEKREEQIACQGGEGSIVPSERTSKSSIGTLSDIGRERGPPGSKTGPICCELAVFRFLFACLHTTVIQSHCSDLFPQTRTALRQDVYGG